MLLTSKLGAVKWKYRHNGLRSPVTFPEREIIYNNPLFYLTSIFCHSLASFRLACERSCEGGYSNTISERTGIERLYLSDKIRTVYWSNQSSECNGYRVYFPGGKTAGAWR